jgi:ribonucleoside-diphosphate reductase alpha subunit
MKVIKRSGRTEEVSFDKVIRRLQSLCNEEPKIEIDIIDIARQVIAEICDGIKTSELDISAAEKCAYMVTVNPAYGKLAGRIVVSNMQKNTSSSFSETVNMLHNHKDMHGKSTPLISDEVYTIVQIHKHKLNDVIDYTRDFNFDYFAFMTLARAYIIKINGEFCERIQDMFMRVAIGIHAKKILAGEDTIKNALKTYDLMSTQYFTHATPTLFHAGTPNPQLLSCFLLGIGDSIGGIYKCISDCAQISKWAGGIGVHIANIRAEGSVIRGTNGKSNGIVPMLKVFNETARYVDQCVLPETMIYTTKGPMEIQYCEAGVTEIFTSNGPEVIENVLEHAYEGKMLEIKSANSRDVLTITSEHPVYCLKNPKGLTNEHIITRLRNGLIKPEWIDADDLNPGDMLINTIPTYEKDIEHLTEEDCYMYGVMVASLMTTNADKCFGIIIDYSDTQRKVVDFIVNYLTKRCIAFDIKYGSNKQDVDEPHLKEPCNISWKKTTTLPFRYTDFYGHTRSRHMSINPKWVNLPLNKTNNILKGLFHTCGVTSYKPLRYCAEYEQTYLYVNYMLLRMGVLTKNASCGGEEHMTIPKTAFIKELLGIKSDDIPDTCDFLRHENRLFSRISNMEEIEYSGTLYDLQMKDTHDYMLTSGIVHNGGGKRKGSIAMYLPPWHADVEKFIDMKKNHGKEEERARDLFFALWIPDIFMCRVRDNKQWSLMCPDECPGLADVYGTEFEELYEKYEKDGCVRKTMPARDLYAKICKAQIETGGPYMLYCDAANRKTNQKNIGMIKSSNLCSEILEVSSTDEYACCTLASVSLSTPVTDKNFENVKEVLVYTKDRCNYCKLVKMLCKQHNLPIREVNLTEKDEELVTIKAELKTKYDADFETFPQVLVLTNDHDHGEQKRQYTYIGGYSEFEEYTRPWFDFKKLAEVTKVVAKNLNRIIDINKYPVPETERSNMRHRPIGIGTQGLADAYAMMRYPFDSPEAAQLNREIFATMYYAALETSMELAIEEGPYSTFKGSPLSEGKFQFDLWDEENLARGGKGIKPLCEVGYKDLEKTCGFYDNHMTLDWDTLRAKIMEHGVRNSLSTASMPTASTSQILGNNECNEAFTSTVYLRRTLAGEFVVINKYGIRDFINLGIWNKRMKEMLIYFKGSPVNIDEIPLVLRNLYKTTWDIKQKHIVDQALDRGIYICQTQSMNVHIAHPKLGEVYKLHMYAWERGAKTGLYYLRTKGGQSAQQVTIDPKFAKELEDRENEKKRTRQLSNTVIVESNENRAFVEQIKGFAGNKQEACENCSA